MEFKNVFVILFIAGAALQFLLTHLLEFIDWKHRKVHGRKIPSELFGHIDQETLDKTCRYEDAKYCFWIPKNLLSFSLSLVLLFSGFYPFVFESLWNWCGRSFVTFFLFILIASIPGVVLEIPFDLYKEFRLEKKFGFSTMTLKLWILDQIKGLLVSLVISGALLFVLVFLVEHCPSWWWILLASVYTVFSLVLSIIYPMFIAPLFNKFTPLEQGELRTRLENLLSKCGFKSNGLFVMDASKRSKHSNAYFTGFGKSKRVVLYDTLVAQLSPEEIESVLGHELGHYKHHHILKRMIIMIPAIFALLFAVNLFINHVSLYSGFGFDVSQGVLPHMKPLGLFFLLMIFEGFTVLLSPVTNYFSRRDEFQADAFAKKVCGTGEHLSTALIKLNKENLSEITPPKIYSLFYYSHPPLLERIRAVKD